MKFHLPAAIIFFSLTGAAFALTEAEITPAALAGKKLTFTIDTAGGPFASAGTWSGTFAAAPSNAFTVADIDSNTVGFTTTHTSTSIGPQTQVSLPVFIAGSPPATIFLYIGSGVGRYELTFEPLDKSYQIGTFTVGLPEPDEAEIAVMQPADSELTDGKTTKSFGSVKVGKTGKARKFFIKNEGGKTLNKLAVKTSGANKGSFIVSDLKVTSLAPGASASFKVSFKPSKKGTLKAALAISSDDSDENPFDIKLTGAGVKK